MILVRHGESHFNVHFSVTREDPGIVDPGLTEKGEAQARQAAEILQGHEGLNYVIASPYWRTLHTAEIIAASLNLPVRVDPVIGERAFFACDVGSPAENLHARWPSFSFDGLATTWWPESGETDEGIQRRSDIFRQRMAEDSAWDQHLIVSHWGFIRALTGHEVPNGSIVRYDPISGESTLLHQTA
ncbi:MAG: histidine phosphatase family protein [Pseudomonadota bacterium]